MSGQRSIDDNILMEIQEYAAMGAKAPVTFIPEPDPEPLFCPIISVDDHALEPPDLFANRVPRAFRDQAPRVEYDEVGLPWWVIDGKPSPLLLVNGGCGRASHRDR